MAERARSIWSAGTSSRLTARSEPDNRMAIHAADQVMRECAVELRWLKVMWTRETTARSGDIGAESDRHCQSQSLRVLQRSTAVRAEAKTRSLWRPALAVPWSLSLNSRRCLTWRKLFSFTADGALSAETRSYLLYPSRHTDGRGVGLSVIGLVRKPSVPVKPP